MTGGSIADGNITLINQRHVGDDLPVNFFSCFYSDPNLDNPISNDQFFEKRLPRFRILYLLC